MADQLDVLRLIASRLDQLGIQYMLTGSVAAGWYEIEKFDRRRRLEVERQPVWVIAPEDLILSKLAWAKHSPSELQLRDVRAMIAVQQDLDWEHIDRWAVRLTVRSLLAGVRP